MVSPVDWLCVFRLQKEFIAFDEFNCKKRIYHVRKRKSIFTLTKPRSKLSLRQTAKSLNLSTEIIYAFQFLEKISDFVVLMNVNPIT